MKQQPSLTQGESGRPVIYIASSSWYGGAATNMCVFSSREEAIRWAKCQARGFIDFEKWTGDSEGYPYEPQRDNQALNPTFRATWKTSKGGFVEVRKTEVCGVFDWSANPLDAPEQPKPSLQEMNRERTETLEKLILSRGVEVEIGPIERNDFHCWYTGSDGYVMHTYASKLALAVSELARIRNRKKVTVRVTDHGFVVSAKPIKLRNVNKCEENHADRSHD